MYGTAVLKIIDGLLEDGVITDEETLRDLIDVGINCPPAMRESASALGDLIYAASPDRMPEIGEEINNTGWFIGQLIDMADEYKKIGAKAREILEGRKLGGR